MKQSLLAAGVAVLLIAATITSAANLRAAAPPAPRGEVAHLALMASLALASTNLQLHEQAAGTPGTTPTGTVSVTPGTTPVPSPTTSPTNVGPDPLTLLQNMFSIWTVLLYTHFSEVQTGLQQQPDESLKFTYAGEETCKGPSLYYKENAAATLGGTSQSTKRTFWAIQIGKKAWIKKTAHGKWAGVKPANLTLAGFSIDPPLICTTSSGSGSGGPTLTPKGLNNLGAETYQGIPVWHVQEIAQETDSAGNSYAVTLDFLMSQDHFLPEQVSDKVVDSTHSVTVTETINFSKQGSKVTIAKPKGTKP